MVDHNPAPNKTDMQVSQILQVLQIASASQHKRSKIANLLDDYKTKHANTCAKLNSQAL